MQQVGEYTALARCVRALMEAGSVLTPEQMGVFAPHDRAQIEAARRSIAVLQAMMRQALSTTSGRFAAIEQLIGGISRASDQKAILELQARIAAEECMLQNEQTKLQVLYQAAQSEGAALESAGSQACLPAASHVGGRQGTECPFWIGRLSL